jgi:hypothetical protein
MRYGICVPSLGEFADPRQVAGLARRAEEAGWDGDPAPFDVVITGQAPALEPARAADHAASMAAAGATWWLEGFRPRPGEHDAALRRIEAGPPGASG